MLQWRRPDPLLLQDKDQAEHGSHRKTLNYDDDDDDFDDDDDYDGPDDDDHEDAFRN